VSFFLEVIGTNAKDFDWQDRPSRKSMVHVISKHYEMPCGLSSTCILTEAGKHGYKYCMYADIRMSVCVCMHAFMYVCMMGVYGVGDTSRQPDRHKQTA
jgi:hypothetical protein